MVERYTADLSNLIISFGKGIVIRTSFTVYSSNVFGLLFILQFRERRNLQNTMLKFFFGL